MKLDKKDFVNYESLQEKVKLNYLFWLVGMIKENGLYNILALEDFFEERYPKLDINLVRTIVFNHLDVVNMYFKALDDLVSEAHLHYHLEELAESLGEPEEDF